MRVSSLLSPYLSLSAAAATGNGELYYALAKSIDASAVIFELSVRACVCVSNPANALRPRCDVPS